MEDPKSNTPESPTSSSTSRETLDTSNLDEATSQGEHQECQDGIAYSSNSGSETEDEKSEQNINANPTEVTDRPSVYCYPPSGPKKGQDLEARYGKWLVFRPFSQIDETWHMIRREVEDGQLSSLTTEAKAGAMFYNPSCGGPGPCTASVICVYTTASNVDRAGSALIELVKHDIKYKTDEATLDGKYAWKGGKKSVCLKTLYWNDGKPSFTREGQTCYGPDCRHITDEWHLNEVFAPVSIMEKSTVYGRWVVELEYEWNLTNLWQSLRQKTENGEFGPVKMVCPPKRNRKDPSEKPVFLIYTAYENKELVGRELSCVVPKDVKYELSERPRAYRGTQPLQPQN